MKLESITVENYRQFENAELTFDDGVTILAGANNSGKTSLIHLIKNIFVNEKNDYNVSDIPAANMREWIEWAYTIFESSFKGGIAVEAVNDMVEQILPQDGTALDHSMETTRVKLHVSYDPKKDDIRLFATYIMDLDSNKQDFYFLFSYEVVREKFAKAIVNEFVKIERRFDEILNTNRDKLTEKGKENLETKERHLKHMIVSLYVQSMEPAVYYCASNYENKIKFDDVKEFRALFNFWFIKASRPLDDEDSDHSHLLSKQMIRMAKLDYQWNNLIERLPDQILNSIQGMEIDKKVRNTSLQSLKETISSLEQTNGGRSGELTLDMQVTEDDIGDLLQRITTASYNVGGYYLGESSQGLGYSNMIYIHLQLDEYKKSITNLKVNMFFLEEPESHMHPQMQQVFIKYLIGYCKENLQGLITTHSNEMVRVAGITRLRVIRRADDFKSILCDVSTLSNKLDKFKDKEAEDRSGKPENKELADFFDWFFEIGYSEIVFADKAIFYEGDTERLFMRKAMTLAEYEKLSQQYVAFIQVGGAYAKNYEKLIRLLGIKSLIITDIDYEKDIISLDKVGDSKITNATIKHFYKLKHPSEEPIVKNLYSWKDNGENIIDDLIMVCFQTNEDGYARTLEEAMLNKLFSMDVSKTLTKKRWIEKKDNSKLIFSIPGNRSTTNISVRDILKSSSGNKTDFMYSVILNDLVEKMMPNYIDGGLRWLME